jgi:hypothetical protein
MAKKEKNRLLGSRKRLKGKMAKKNPQNQRFENIKWQKMAKKGINRLLGSRKWLKKQNG